MLYWQRRDGAVRSISLANSANSPNVTTLALPTAFGSHYTVVGNTVFLEELHANVVDVDVLAIDAHGLRRSLGVTPTNISGASDGRYFYSYGQGAGVQRWSGAATIAVAPPAPLSNSSAWVASFAFGRSAVFALEEDPASNTLMIRRALLGQGAASWVTLAVESPAAVFRDQLEADGNFAYWANPAQHHLMRVAVGGGAPHILWSAGNPTSFAVGHHSIVVADANKHAIVELYPK